MYAVEIKPIFESVTMTLCCPATLATLPSTNHRQLPHSHRFYSDIVLVLQTKDAHFC